MLIRKAVTADAPEILRLLSQVLEVHAAIRPDVFVSGTTKYSREEVETLISDDGRRSFVAVDDGGSILGYALCIVRKPAVASTMVPHTILFIDDLCVDESARGQHVGTALFEAVRSEAKALGCYEVALNVWEGNDAARAFYDKMGMKPKETQMELILR